MTRAVIATGSVRYAELGEDLRPLLGADVTDVPQLLRDIAMVSEGMCPVVGHGPLRLRALRRMGTDLPAAGWCDQCQRGYTATSHRHDEDCAGPGLDEAHLWCPYNHAEPTIAWWDPVAFVPECRWCGQQNGHAPGCPLGGVR